MATASILSSATAERPRGLFRNLRRTIIEDDIRAFGVAYYFSGRDRSASLTPFVERGEISAQMLRDLAHWRVETGRHYEALLWLQEYCQKRDDHGAVRGWSLFEMLTTHGDRARNS